MSGNRNDDPGPNGVGLPTLPPGWCWTTVGELGDVRLGRQRSPQNCSQQYPTKYIRAANLTWTGLDLSDVFDMDFKPSEMEAYRLLPGDVLLSEASGSAGEVGKPVIWQGEIENCCFQNTVIRFRPKEMPPGFPLVIFSHFARNGIFSRAAKGVGIHHLSADRFANLPMPLAPLDEQHRIVAKVEELFSDLDAGMAALERAKTKLKRYRAAVLSAAVEGRLTAEWRAQYPATEPASKLLDRILAERRKRWEADHEEKYKAAGKTAPQSWREKYIEPTPPDTAPLPDLPQNWCWANVDQLIVAPTCNGISVKGSDVPPGVVALRLSAMTDTGFNYEERRYIPISSALAESLRVLESDFFVSRGNGSLHLVGRGTLAQAPPGVVVFPDTMIRVRLAKAGSLARFMNLIWQSRLIREQIEKKARTTAGIYKI